MGGENDLSASITRAFLVQEMSRDGTSLLLPLITYDFAFSNFRDCRKNTSIIEKS